MSLRKPRSKTMRLRDWECVRRKAREGTVGISVRGAPWTVRKEGRSMRPASRAETSM